MHHFMSKDLSIPRRNKVNWPYVRDHMIFSTIKVTADVYFLAFDTDEGTGSKSGVLDVPSDDSEEEISWNSSDDEDVDA
nr:hypothetical protein [Tanacetum cinerariifolium]